MQLSRWHRTDTSDGIVLDRGSCTLEEISTARKAERGQKTAQSWKRMGESSNGSEKEFESLINTESCRHDDKTLNY